MRIFLKKKKWMAWVVMLVFLFVSIMPTAALAKPGNGNGHKGDSSVTATVPTTDIAVEKIWNDEDNEAGKRPNEIKVGLYEGETPVQTIELTSDGNWEGTFTNVPVYDGNGKRIEYTVVEENVPEGYTSVVTRNPVVNGVDGSFVKIPEKNTSKFSIDSTTDIVLIKTANNADCDYCIWTRKALTDVEKAALLEKLNVMNLHGNGESPYARTTKFASGDSTKFEVTMNSKEKFTIKVDNNQLEFGHKKVWAMFWTGSINFVEAQKAVITNTYNPVVPEPKPETGSIKIQKSTVLKGEGDKETPLPVTQSYQFTITPQEGITLPATLEIKNNIADAKVTVKNNVATVTVPLNNETSETVEISGLPAGSYVVNETEESKADLNAEYKFDSVSAIDKQVTVLKDSVADVAFKNVYQKAVPEPTPETGSIKIQKNTVLKGEDDGETALPVTRDYHFTITPQDDITLPETLQINNGVADAEVTVEKNVATVTVLFNEESCRVVEIGNLPVGSYKVAEAANCQIDLEENYKFDNVKINYKNKSYNNDNINVLTEKNSVADVIFTNVYQKVEAGGNTEAQTGEFSFVKVDEADTTKTLAGAEFTLYSDENCNYPETDVDMNVVASDGDGVVKFTGLKLGDNGGATYYLKETKAPVGYELPIDKIYTIKFIDNKVNESWTTSNGLGYIVTNKEIYKPELRTGVNVAKLVEFKPNSDGDYTDEEIRKEIDATEFKFHVNLAVLAVTSSSALDYEFANFATFEEAKIAASELRNDAAVEEFSVTDVGKTVTLDENNTAEFEINVKDEATLNFGVNARLSTGSAIIWMQIAEDMDTATGTGLGWESAYDDLDLTTAVNGESGHSIFGQITSGSVYEFMFTNTYTNTNNDNNNDNDDNNNNDNNNNNSSNSGNTGNENTGGNEESNNDTDNTTTIVDEPTPLVNVPEEPMEELLEEPIEEIEIDEPEVPLTEAPGEPVAIEEPEVPLGDAPKTGDSSNAVLFVALMLAAGAGLVVTRRKFN